MRKLNLLSIRFKIISAVTAVNFFVTTVAYAIDIAYLKRQHLRTPLLTTGNESNKLLTISGMVRKLISEIGYSPPVNITPYALKHILRIKLDILKKALPEGVDLGNITAVETELQYRERIVRALAILLRFINPTNGLEDRGKGKLFSVTEGKIVVENNIVKVQLFDPESVLEQDADMHKLYKSFIETLKLFRPVDIVFKAYILVESKIMTIYIDPGKHKGFIAVVLPMDDEKGILLYQHRFSSYEINSPDKSFRKEYILRVLGEVNTVVDKWGIVNVMELESEDMIEQFSKLVRLSHSLKDLDTVTIFRKEDVLFAVRLFEKAVTNIKNFLALVAGFDIRKGSGKEDISEQSLYVRKFLNEDEQAIWYEFLKHQRELEKMKQYIRDKLWALLRAKQLNYEILEKMERFVKCGRTIYGVIAGPKIYPYELDGKKVIQMEGYKIERQYKSLVAKLKEMRRCVYTFRGELTLSLEEEMKSIDELAGKFSKAVSMMDAATEGAEVKNLDQFFEQFQQICNAEGELEDWSDVDSLHEAVLFLHKLLYEPCASRMSMLYRHQLQDLTRSEFHRSFYTEENLPVIDVTENGIQNSTVARVFYSTVSRLSRGIKEELYKISSAGSPFIIIGDDFAEMSFPGPKHRTDIATQIKEGNDEDYGVSVDYYESFYDGASVRLEYARSVLKDLGFNLEQEGTRIIRASLRENNRLEWEKKFSETVRLMHSLNNLDLYPLFTQEHAKELFIKGITNIKTLGQWFLNLEDPKLPINEKPDAFGYVFKIGGIGEKEALVSLLLQKGRPAKEIDIWISELDKKDKDELLGIGENVIDDAYKNGDIKECRRLRQRLAILTKLVDKKESPLSLGSGTEIGNKEIKTNI